MSVAKRQSLKVDLKSCVGCRACTLACAVTHEGRAEFYRARIRIEKHLPGMQVPVFKPLVCRMCRNARCIDVCSTGALNEDPETGLVVLNAELCNGCGNCVEACPFHAIWVDEQAGLAVKCDLCGGQPACVTACSTGALRYD